MSKFQLAAAITVIGWAAVLSILFPLAFILNNEAFMLAGILSLFPVMTFTLLMLVLDFRSL
jgi:hypothetical protein